MTLVKFDHAVKYQGIRYGAHVAFQVEDNDIASLKKAGVIILSQPDKSNNETPNKDKPHTENSDNTSIDGDDIDDTTTTETDDENDSTSEIKEKLLAYTLAQLNEFAKENNIDLQGATKKADVYNIIVAAMR